MKIPRSPRGILIYVKVVGAIFYRAFILHDQFPGSKYRQKDDFVALG